MSGAYTRKLETDGLPANACGVIDAVWAIVTRLGSSNGLSWPGKSDTR